MFKYLIVLPADKDCPIFVKAKEEMLTLFSKLKRGLVSHTNHELQTKTSFLIN